MTKKTPRWFQRIPRALSAKNAFPLLAALCLALLAAQWLLLPPAAAPAKSISEWAARIPAFYALFAAATAFFLLEPAAKIIRRFLARPETHYAPHGTESESFQADTDPR